MMIACSFALLSFNEHRTLAEAMTLAEGTRQVLSGAAAESATPGALVHAAGKLQAERLTDNGFGIAASGLRLTRAVEMWQLRERTISREEHDAHGHAVTVTDTTYSPGWESSAIDSSIFADARFRGAHPASVAWPVQRSTFFARHASVAGLALPAEVISTLGRETPLDAGDPSVSAAGRLLLQAKVDSSGDDVEAEAPLSVMAARRGSSSLAGLLPFALKATVAGGYFHSGQAALGGEPRLGDVRVSFELAAPATATVVGRLAADARSVEPFVVAATGRRILLAYEGEMSAADAFARAAAEERTLAWALRVCGWLLAVIGVGLVLQPLAVAPTAIPFIGNTLGGLVGCGAALFALALGSALTVATVSLAWLAARPLHIVAALAAAATLAYLAVVRTTSGSTATARTAATGATRQQKED